jgi:sugar phosphate permease
MTQALPAIVSRLNRRLMPLLLLMYVLAFLDRTNIGFAKAAFQADTGVSDAAYAFGASIFFIGYALLEVPSNLILHKVGARLWLSRIMVTWGLVSAATTFVHGATAFYVVRTLLGLAEAGFFPGVILYLTYWYPKSARARSTGLFYYGAPLAFILGGPLSGQLLDLNGLFGLKGWQLMFLVEGLLASLAGVVIFLMLDDKPAAAKWLPPEEKRILLAALAGEEDAKPHDLRGAGRALRDPRVLYLSLIYVLIQMGVYGLSFFLPTQVGRLLGAKVGLEVGLVSAIPWIAAVVATTLIPPIADRSGAHRGIGALMLALAAGGLAVSALSASPVIAIIALCFAAAGLIVSQPLFWTLPTGLLGGAGAAGGIALINSIGNLGGFVAPNFRGALESHFATPAAGLLGLSAVLCVGAGLMLAARRY